METLLTDTRYAIAALKRNPSVALAGLLTLALGIGAIAQSVSPAYG